MLLNEGDGICLEGAMVEQSEYHLLNSKRVITTSTPENLMIYPFVVRLLLSLIRFLVVNVEIKFNADRGNIN